MSQSILNKHPRRTQQVEGEKRSPKEEVAVRSIKLFWLVGLTWRKRRIRVSLASHSNFTCGLSSRFI
jgi:hypothetical protein